jgi:endonuclease-3
MYRWNLTNGKMVNRKDAKRIFPEEIWNDLHLQMIWYGREYSPARGWDLENDTITKTVEGKQS